MPQKDREHNGFVKVLVKGTNRYILTEFSSSQTNVCEILRQTSILERVGNSISRTKGGESEKVTTKINKIQINK